MTRGDLAADAASAIDLSLKAQHTSTRMDDGGTITGTASSVPKFNAALRGMPDRQHQNAVSAAELAPTPAGRTQKTATWRRDRHGRRSTPNSSVRLTPRANSRPKSALNVRNSHEKRITSD
jgi:hypothetical protein